MCTSQFIVCGLAAAVIVSSTAKRTFGAGVALAWLIGVRDRGMPSVRLRRASGGSSDAGRGHAPVTHALNGTLDRVCTRASAPPGQWGMTRDGFYSVRPCGIDRAGHIASRRCWRRRR